MKAIEELKFRQRVKLVKPKYVEVKPIGQEHYGCCCYFCPNPAEYWLERVYSFGQNSDRVCGDCADKFVKD